MRGPPDGPFTGGVLPVFLHPCVEGAEGPEGVSQLPVAPAPAAKRLTVAAAIAGSATIDRMPTVSMATATIAATGSPKISRPRSG